MVWKIVLVLVCAYLFGSLPSAYLMGKWVKGIDIRTVGSHNMGTMNTTYTLGIKWGLLVMIMDMGKGALAVLLARYLGLSDLVQFFAGLLAILGHNFPVWLKFKGGKGGATAIGVTTAFMPWIWAISFALFLLLLLISKTPTLSYGVAMVSFPFIGWFLYPGTDYWWYTIVYILIPYLMYIPRLIEMRKKVGSWKKVIFRKSVKERF